MAALVPTATQNANVYASGSAYTKVSAHSAAGVLHFAQWDQYVATTAGVGAIDLIVLPPGRIRIFPDLSRIVTAQFSANSDLHLGFRAYTEPDGDVVAEDDNAFLDNADAGGGALDSAWVLPAIGYADFNVAGPGLRIFATIDTGDIDIGDTIDGWVAYTRIG